MPKNFAVLTSARSGSGWLIDTIHHHESLLAYGELFNPTLNRRHNGIPEYVFSAEMREGRRPLSVRRYLDGFIFSRPRAGFKLLYGHVRRYPEVLVYLRLRGGRIIHLVRRNRLDHKYRLIRYARMALKLLRFEQMDLEYEALCRDPGQFDRVWDFLGVDRPAAGPQSDIVKVQTRTHSEVIENYDEVRSALEGTEFRELLQPAGLGIGG